MQNTLMGNALADRGDGGQCNMPRIPTGRYPAYAQSISATFDANGNATIEFEAERDYLFTDLSIEASTAADLGTMRVNAEYCNTKYLVNNSALIWLTCCERKPVFLVGVRENKRLVFTFTGGTAEATVTVSLEGFQGSGCCG